MLLTTLIAQHPEAITDIVRQTPPWVAGLFAVLAALGFSATRERTISAARLLLMPAVMVGLALWGLVSAFSAGGHLGTVLALWALCLAGVAAFGWRSRPAEGTRFDAASGRYHLPGSWLPMALMLAVFSVKYAVGVQLAMEPGLTHNAVFAAVLAIVYGALSGFFAARTARVLRLGRAAHGAPWPSAQRV